MPSSGPAQPAGAVTSGAPSPTLGIPIAMAYVLPEVAVAASDPTGRERRSLRSMYEAVPSLATLVELPFYHRPA